MKDLKYLNVMRVLREDYIGNPQSDGAIPTENELARRFGISRFPVNRAVQRLVDEGLLVRIDGIGTYIKGKEPELLKSRVRRVPGLISMISETFTPDASLLQAIEGEARAAGMLLASIFFDRERENVRSMVKHLKDSGSSGVILLPSIHFGEGDSPSLELAEALEAKGIPTVVADRPLPGFKGGQVIFDNASGVVKAMQELSRRGHRKIAYFGKDDYIVGRERLMGYRLGLEYCGMKHDESLESLVGGGAGFLPYLDEHALKAAETFKSRHSDCDAFMTFNSTFAWSLCCQMERLGALPGNAIFAGYEIPVCGVQGFIERFMVLKRPFAPLGRVAVEMLLSRINGGKPSDGIMRIMPELQTPEESASTDMSRTAQAMA